MLFYLSLKKKAEYLATENSSVKHQQQLKCPIFEKELKEAVFLYGSM